MKRGTPQRAPGAELVTGTPRCPRRLKLPLFLVATALVLCAPAMNVHSARSPSARFDTYRTFGFDTTQSVPNQYAPSPRSAEVRVRARQQATAIFQAKGYVLMEAGLPDFVVRIAAGRRERDIRLPQPTRVDWLAEDEEEDFVEGAFVIDAFDGRSHELVWHCSGRAAVDPDRINYEQLERDVASALSAFPARIAAR